MKKTICLLIVSVLSASLFAAEQWIDVTSAYITNPAYDNSSNAGWTINANAGSTNCSYTAQEFWNGTWDLSQTIAIPNGHYRISVNAYHRPGSFSSSAESDWENVEITSLLYANDTSTPLKSIYSESLSSNYNNGCWSSTGSWGGWGSSSSSSWYPNNMEVGEYCFEQSMYANELEFDVTNGTLTFGIKNSTYVSSNWTICDNWKLEYYGELTAVTGVSFSQTSMTIVVGEQKTLTATVTPSNATLKNLKWTSSDENVVTVDNNGNVKAISTGNATITATATDGSGKKASCQVTAYLNTAGLKNLVINEIQNANIDQIIDPSWNYGGWIELYNPGTSGVCLKGCWLSDDPENLMKAHITEAIAISSKSYLNLWFDHHDKYCPSQVNMKLDVDGGTIYLSDSNGKLLTSMTYPEAIARCSYARKTLGSEEWGWTSTPTPEASNDGCSYSETRLEAPVVDQNTQIFGTTITVCVNIPSGATLRYTTDGSTPTATNGKTSTNGLFYPTSTTTYRFGLIQDGYLPSPIVTRTYIYQDKDFTLPVFSVVSDNANLYGADYGILTKGNGNGRAGNGQSGACNWNMDWDRPVNFEYLDENGAMVINQETEMERCGGWSRAWLPYSFKIKANKRYEQQSYLPYDFFTEKPYLKHKGLQIRNGGNDNTCRFKDPALQEIVFRSGLNIACQGYQPAMHYINGKYAGVINVREPNNKNFVYANYGLDDDEIDQFEMSPDSGYVQKCGTYESMQRWYDLSQDCADETVYEQIKQMVDIDEYCNYMATEFFLGGTDWPQNNVKGFKPIMDGGKFHFVLFDLDGTFGTTDPFNTFAWKQNYTFDYLYGEDTDHITKEIEFVTIFLNILQNEEFKKQFIDSYCLVAGSVFKPSRCSEIINELANRVSDAQSISSEVYGNGSTPWSTANSLISSLSNRASTMINALTSYSKFGLSASNGQSVQLSANISDARLLVNNLPVPTNKFDGKLFAPIKLKAEAPACYKFLGWKLVEGTAGATTILPSGSEWSYYDQGSLDANNWTSTKYDASSWNTGQSPIGYGKSGLATTMTSNLSTYYLRTNLTLSSKPNTDDIFTLDWTADDGFIIYVNGTEAGRYNMPSGDVTYSDLATTYANGNPDTGTLTLETSLFQKGNNTIAVELHNNATTSSDIYWEASISQASNEATGSYVSTEEEFTMPTGTLNLQACYGEMTEAEKIEAGITTSPIVINEVSAANSINVNEYYKKDDWVELYNTTDADIDLEGMYMTDKSDTPMKYQITAVGTKASTIIPAHGYKVIWCSHRDTDKELHANFKLNNEDGSMVRIMAQDGSWADSLIYCAHNGDQTVGRYPDGGQNIYLMDLTTIKAANKMSTYATYWEYVAPEDTTIVVDHILTTRNGGMSIACVDNYLSVKSEEDAHVHVCVYATTGAIVMQRNLNLETAHDKISVASLPAGVYVARATDSEGNECATKFLKQ